MRNFEKLQSESARSPSLRAWAPHFVMPCCFSAPFYREYRSVPCGALDHRHKRPFERYGESEPSRRPAAIPRATPSLLFSKRFARMDCNRFGCLPAPSARVTQCHCLKLFHHVRFLLIYAKSNQTHCVGAVPPVLLPLALKFRQLALRPFPNLHRPPLYVSLPIFWPRRASHVWP